MTTCPPPQRALPRGALAAALIASLAPAFRASAQTIEYDVIDLGTLAGGSGFSEIVPERISENLVIAGRLVDRTLGSRPFAWMYSDAFGLPGRQLLNLTTLGGLSSSHFGEALDVNNADFIVGGHGASATTTSPFVWQLATYNSSTQTPTATALSLAGYTDGRARGINESIPPQIVGSLSHHRRLPVRLGIAERLVHLSAATGFSRERIPAGRDDINSPDLAILLGEWGACDSCNPTLCEGGDSAMMESGGSWVTEEMLNLASAALGFASFAEFQSWISATESANTDEVVVAFAVIMLAQSEGGS